MGFLIVIAVWLFWSLLWVGDAWVRMNDPVPPPPERHRTPAQERRINIAFAIAAGAAGLLACAATAWSFMGPLAGAVAGH